MVRCVPADFVSIFDSVPTVLEDYIHLLLELVEHAPDVFFQSSAFPLAFRATMTALTIIHSDIIFRALDLFRIILTHDCLTPNTPQPPKFPVYAAAINGVVESEGFTFVGYLLAGLIGHFPEDSTSTVVSIFRMLAALWTAQLLAWLPPILEQLPTAAAPNQAKAQFLADVTRYAKYKHSLFVLTCLVSSVNNGEFDKVKYAIITLHRVSRKVRDRRRAGPLDH